MTQRILHIADSHQSADRIARQQDAQVTPLQWLEAFMKLMEPHYAAASGLQRICRIDDRPPRQVRDDWGGLLTISNATRDRPVISTS